MDNSFDVVNASGNLLQSSILVRRAISGDGVDLDSARRMLTDFSLTMQTLIGAVYDVKEISAAFSGGRSLPNVKVAHAVQDLDELASGLKLAHSAAFAASRSLCGEFDRGIPSGREMAVSPTSEPSTAAKAQVKATAK